MRPACPTCAAPVPKRDTDRLLWQVWWWGFVLFLAPVAATFGLQLFGALPPLLAALLYAAGLALLVWYVHRTWTQAARGWRCRSCDTAWEVTL